MMATSRGILTPSRRWRLYSYYDKGETYGEVSDDWRLYAQSGSN
jgi:hypothetical protein